MTELADLPEKDGPVLVHLFSAAEIECTGCQTIIRVQDNETGVERAERFLARHRGHHREKS